MNFGTARSPPTASAPKEDNNGSGSSCKKCVEPDAAEDMVRCDDCHDWFHFSCVGVSSEQVRRKPWSCEQCACTPTTVIERTKSITATKSVTSRRSRNSAAKRLEIELMRLEEERELQKKRDKDYVDQKYQLMHEINEEETSEDEDFPDPVGLQVKEVNDWVQNNPTSSTTPVAPATNRTKTAIGPEIQIPPIINALPTGIVHTARSQPNTVPKASTAQFCKPVMTSFMSPQNTYGNTFPMGYNFPSTTGPNQFAPNSVMVPPQPLDQNQIAARHVMPKELPTFTGRPEEWPLFFFSYENSTRICGFSNEENLFRLTRCLKGSALEAVRGRLMHPAGVNDVIQTLKLLYGRPQLIIDTLLRKLRLEPAPKVEKLDTLIQFSLSVQNICSTMETCGLQSHICDPTLLQELTDKLPGHVKLNWAMFKQNIPNATISTLSNWLFQIALAAGDVTTYAPGLTVDNKNQSKGKFVNIHQEKVSPTVEHIRKCCICKNNCKSVAVCAAFLAYKHGQKWAAVRDNKLCRNCLAPHTGHCRKPPQCDKDNCTARHHRLLHNENSSRNLAPVPTIPQEPCNAHLQCEQSILFRIVPVVLSSNGKSISTYAFLDEGSSVTLMEDEIGKQLGLKGEIKPLCLKWTADTRRIENNSKEVSLDIAAALNPEVKFPIYNVRTVKSLNLPIQSISAFELRERFTHLEDVPIQSYEKATPRILIGLDNWKLGLPRKSKEAKNNEPIASKTLLGWTISGPYNPGGNYSHHSGFHHHHYHVCEHKSDNDLHDLVNEFFAIDSIGVSKSGNELLSKDDERAMAIMEATTRQIGARYETGLIWKFDNVSLLDSYGMAKRRLACLEKRLSRDQELYTVIDQKIQDHLDKGYIRKLPPTEIQTTNKWTWYLPIFPVINPNKQGKVRIVWDAAAKVNGISLNSMLLKGPDMLLSLQGILIRFRERRVALSGDIREMFLQV